MTSHATQALSEALEGHIRLIRDLIEVSQREYARIISFEHRSLATATEEKRALLSQIQASETAIAGRLAQCASLLQLDDPHPTAAQIAELLEGPEAEQLMNQVSTLRSLSESFRELQAVCLYHAERGLTLVRSYSALLRGQDPDAHQGPDIYTPGGRAHRTALPSKTVSRNA